MNKILVDYVLEKMNDNRRIDSIRKSYTFNGRRDLTKPEPYLLREVYESVGSGMKSNEYVTIAIINGKEKAEKILSILKQSRKKRNGVE